MSARSPHQRPILRRMARWSAAALAAVVVAVALAISVTRIVIEHAPEYRDDVTRRAAEVLGAPVEIGGLDVRWRTLRPELVLQQVRFVSADATRAFAAPEIRVGLSLRALVTDGRLVPARIVLVAPDVTIDLDRPDTTAVDRWRRTFERHERSGTLIVESGRLELSLDGGTRRVTLERLDARIASDGASHRFALTASVPGTTRGTVEAEIRARGWPGESGLRGSGHLELLGIDLVAVQEFGRGRLRTGTLDVVADLSVEDGSARRLEVDFGLSSLRWTTAPGSPERTVNRGAGRVEWIHRDGGWDAVLRGLSVARAGGTTESGPLRIEFTTPAAGEDAAYWRIDANSVVIEDLAVMREVLPWGTSGLSSGFLDRGPRGRVESAELSLRHAAGEPLRWSLRASIDGLGLDRGDGPDRPGFDGVGGTVTADQDGGRAVIESAGGSVDFTPLFRAPFPLGRAVAEVQWTREPAGWRVAVPRIAIDNDDVAVVGRGTLAVPADGVPTIRLDADFDDAALASKSPYLPVGIMSDTLVAWLDRAVVGGVARDGKFMYAGVLRSGALKDGGAVMDIEFEAADIELDYADDWPKFAEGEAQVHFTGTGFDAQVNGGLLGGARVPTARVDIMEYAERHLVIDGQVNDDLERALTAFRATPVGAGAWTRSLHGRGDVDVGLRVLIPLDRTADTTVRGSVALAGATVSVDALQEPLTDVRGRVEVTERGITAQGMRARFLGHDLDIAARNDDDATTLLFSGTMDTHGVARLAGREDLPVVGSFAWLARLDAPHGDDQTPRLRVESALEGLAVDLPAPLGKAAATATPVAATIDLGETRRALAVDAGNVGRVDVEFIDSEGGWRMTRGRAHLGASPATALPDSDFAISGRIAAWNHDGRVEASRYRVAIVDVTVGALVVSGHPLGEVHVRGDRADTGWYWRFEGERVSGTLDRPERPTNERPLRAEFARLLMPAADDDGEEGKSPDARDLSPLVFHVRAFRWGVVDLGEVNGFIRRVENGVAMEGFTATRRDMRINADASWHTVDGYHRTVLRGTLDSTDVRRTLAALGYRGSIEAAAGHLQVDLNWLASPLQSPLPLLDGTASIRLENGQLTDVQAGAGRVFGLLSVSALPRRLALDFSDFFGRGLAFDTIQGDFRIDDGDAVTDGLVLRGPAAHITLKGRTGLATRDYDQEVEVIGTFRTSLALAGTLAGGPGVGAALLIASQLLKRPLEDLARVRYRMTGTWESPEFERLQEAPREPR